MTDRHVRELDAATRGAEGTVVLVSANPIHDTGGGQRSAQLALELLERGYAVVFVSHGEVTETVDLDLRYDQPRLIRWGLDEATADSVREALVQAAKDRGMILTQVPVRAWLPLLERAADEGVPTVYDCIDRWQSELGRGWYRSDVEAEVARVSTVLTASAPVLVDHVESLTGGRETRLLPNAFNARIFSEEAGAERPQDLPDARRVALYVGALWGGWMDWGLVRAAADAHPDTSFVFVGDHRGEGRALPDHCHFLGLKPQAALPGYLAHADLGFLPWKVSGVTRATSPLKVYEFIATGLPVVAPDLEPLRGIPGVRTTRGRSAFIQALGATGRRVVGDDEATAMRRFARESSWSRRVDELLEVTAEPDAPLDIGGRSKSVRSPSARGRPLRSGSLRGGASISVVVPAFQHEPFVGRAVESARRQSLPAAEIVVVDDGSTDGTAEAAERAGGPSLRLVRQPNRGAHHALNRGIRLSRGEWVAILNSDDVFAPERLERAWGVARETGAALVFGSVRLIGEDGGPVDPSHDIARWHAEASAWARGRSVSSVLRRHNLAVTTSNFFLHRELWTRLGGFRAYRYVHDWDFLLRALELCPRRVVHEPSLDDVLYRVHGENTITERDGRAAEEREEMRADLRRPWGRLKRSVTGWRSRRRLARVVDASGALAPGVAGDVGEGPEETRSRSDGEGHGGGAGRDGERGRGGGGAARGRVGLVVDSLGTGGLEEVVALLAQALPGLGVETRVLCARGEGAVARRLRGAGIAVESLGGRLDRAGEWARRERIAAVSSHFAPVEVVRGLAEAGVPVVETVQNTYAWFGDEDWEVEKARAEVVAGVIAVSDVAAAYYQRHTGHRPDSVVPNAVNPGRAARVPVSFARARLDLGVDDPVFAFVGRITQQKNPAGLVRAFALARATVPEAVLLLVGPADSSGGLPSLRRRHRDLFDAGAVRHLRRPSHVGTVLSAADAFVSDAYYEGWSVAASEACWVGRPVVLSETGGSAALVGGGGARGILVANPLGDPLDVRQAGIGAAPGERGRENEDELAAAMIRVAGERPAWRAQADDIRAWAREEVSPGRMASRYVEILEAVAASPIRPKTV